MGVCFVWLFELVGSLVQKVRENYSHFTGSRMTGDIVQIAIAVIELAAGYNLVIPSWIVLPSGIIIAKMLLLSFGLHSYTGAESDYFLTTCIRSITSVLMLRLNEWPAHQQR